ncbi:site-specific DNA-methyltransferase [Flavobacterium paronense]|uniref:site-specific DNA-methyltransferase (adenine-specific) n=1 Tax=Flavobacterium paronense TaxID=1392775 RepID=A0ABV5GBL0_9FLAO|nr:site-specific DNA-methyltransferase [Flavobacterium paronense]MDN3677668.1 site-specific DNA-methyltransferase [Flavobacterium paronense]
MPTLHWIGKDKIINHHQEVPYKVLNHEYGFSENGKTETSIATGNLIINGDNLEALKSLLPKYEGKVNCIYIDPPYNTGNESWVYNDNVNAPQIKKWLGKVVGKESEDLTRHDKWLCMMYPRLKLLHKLLSKNGFIFISLDDNEIHSMKFMLNEIFGEKNFQAEIIVQSNKRGQTYKQIAKTHEYLICFSKSEISNINELPTEVGEYPYEDELGKYSIRELRNRNPKFGRFNRPNLFFPIYVNPKNPDKNGFCPISLKKDDDFTIEVLPLNSQKEESCWRWGTKKVEENITHENDMDSIFGKPKQDGSWGVYDKYRKGTVKAKTIWTETEMISEQGTSLLRNLGLAEVFQFPKPIELIKRVLLLGTDENSIVLDSFAGSGTTAHAVLNLNKQDGGNRKFILIEMEDYAETITAERVKRVIGGYADVEATGGSFNFYTLGEPLFDDNNNLNETVGVDKIREYVWFTETRSTKAIAKNANPYLGVHNDTAYYFIYNQDSLTTLDYESLASYIQQKAERYIIYADNCLLPETFLREKNIEFKKIPRDITRF